MEAKRQVKAISGFDVHAQPSYLEGSDLPPDPETGAVADNIAPDQYKVSVKLCDRMSLHREVECGIGFFDWMTTKASNV